MSKHITSREYKLMLNTDRFQDREEGLKAFWDLVSYIVKKRVVAMRSRPKVWKNHSRNVVHGIWTPQARISTPPVGCCANVKRKKRERKNLRPPSSTVLRTASSPLLRTSPPTPGRARPSLKRTWFLPFPANSLTRRRSKPKRMILSKMSVMSLSSSQV